MIHQYIGAGWAPGLARREGSHPFPAAPHVGQLFNDVTGGVGATPDQVVEGLPEFLMKRGELAKLMPASDAWPELSQRVKNALEGDRNLPLIIAYLQMGVDEVVAVEPLQDWPHALATEVADFVMAFLKANGQIDHIRHQPWWRNGHHRLHIEVACEVARSVGSLNWHKDTSGDILFSNLVFTQAVPATEWSPDYAAMSAEKTAAVRRFWPDALLTEIETARGVVRQRLGPTPRIEGGILAPLSYLSWVDDLVWHSTPSLRPRGTYTLEMAQAIAGDNRFTEVTYDLLLQVLLTPNSHLGNWLSHRGVNIEPMELGQAERLWRSVFEGPDQAAAHEALALDIKAIDWTQRKTDTLSGTSLAAHEDVPDSPVLQMPTGMAGRSRANSDPAQLQAIKSLAALRDKRSFLSVFVSVRPIG